MIVDFTPFLCAALAALSSCHRKLNTLYQAEAGKCLVAAQKYSNKNHRAFQRGRAEKQVLAYRALGVIVHYKNVDDTASINSLLRAADRRLYDQIMTGKGAVETAPILDSIAARSISEYDMTNLAILLYAIINTSGRPMSDDVLTDGLVEIVRNTMRMDAARDNLSPAAIAKSKQLLSHYDHLTASDFFNQSPPELQDELDELFALANVLGISLTEYCAGIELTDEEAAWATTNKTRYVERAILACLFKAIRIDRDFCLNMAQKDKSAELEAAKLEASRAKQEADQVRSRLTEVERIAQDAERRAAKAEAALSETADEVQELAALRAALYAAQTPEAPTQEAQPQRAIPQGVVVVGGYDAWAKGMREQFPTVTVYPASVTCDPTVIRSASELWLKADYISHSDFYRVVAIARQYHVPIHYFSGCGVQRCVSELTAQTERRP